MYQWALTCTSCLLYMFCVPGYSIKHLVESLQSRYGEEGGEESRTGLYVCRQKGTGICVCAFECTCERELKGSERQVPAWARILSKQREVLFWQRSPWFVWKTAKIAAAHVLCFVQVSMIPCKNEMCCLHTFLDVMIDSPASWTPPKQ